jgi:hypothetical protein
MKTQFAYYSFLLCLLLLPLDGFPIYDRLAIDIKPTADDVTFCFKPDYNEDVNTYLAAQVGSNFFFIPHLAKQPSEYVLLTGELSDMKPPWFAKKGDLFGCTTIPCPGYYCVGPFPKSLLQGISIYAGLGTSLTEVTSNPKNYAKIFDGKFITLPLQPTREWTVMVYMIGSSFETDPQRFASQDLIEMLNGTQQMVSDNVNLVLTTGGSTREGWKTVKRAFIHQGQYYIIDDLGKRSMATPDTLSEFVPWAITQFPANHYALILWDHGSGAISYGLDTSEGGLAANSNTPDQMTLTELHQAFQTIRSQIAKPLDIVSYDACRMATIEVAEVTSTLAPAMSASVEKEPSHGADYNYLLTHLATNPSANGLDFGKLLKAAYLQQTQQQLSKTSEQTTWKTDQITYSVLDLTQLPTFRNTFQKFATELDNVLRNTDFLNPDSSYKMLSHGMIHAPIYPAVLTKTLRSKSFGQAINEQDVHIDLYAVLQTVLPDFPDLKSDADNLLTQLTQLVVEYEANSNVKKIHPDAGRLSINIGTNLPYVKELPEAYSLLYHALAYYNQRKANDLSNLNDDSQKSCYDTSPGMTCAAFPNWLSLPASEVLKVEAYLGQYTEKTDHIYLMKTLYESQEEVTQKIELGIDGNQACDYQVCVNDTDCASITLTEQNDQRFADITLNDNPAVLTFCQGEDKQWQACSVMSQTDGIWGRSSVLYPDDTIAPTTLQWSDGKDTLEEITGKTLTVAARPVILKQHCDPAKAVIITSSYGANLQPAYRELCREASCVCTTEDLTTEPGDDACKKVGTKAGVIVEP